MLSVGCVAVHVYISHMHCMGAVREPVYEWCTGLHGSMRGGADKCTKRTARVHGPEVWLIGMVVGFLHAEVGMQVRTHVLCYYVWEAYRAASMQCVLAGLHCLIVRVCYCRGPGLLSLGVRVAMGHPCDVSLRVCVASSFMCVPCS